MSCCMLWSFRSAGLGYRAVSVFHALPPGFLDDGPSQPSRQAASVRLVRHRATLHSGIYAINGNLSQAISLPPHQHKGHTKEMAGRSQGKNQRGAFLP